MRLPWRKKEEKVAESSCPACGATVPADASFCEACGADIATGPGPAAAAPGDPGPAAAQGNPGAPFPPAGSPGLPAVPGSPAAPAPAANATPIMPGAPVTTPPPPPAPQPVPEGTTSAPADPRPAPGQGPGPGGPAPVSEHNVDPASLPQPEAAATPAPPAEGEESPLDIGWTGVVPGAASSYDATPVAVRCGTCGEGVYTDGYCDQCGAKEPNPRDHLEENVAVWVGGVSDIGRRHSRNEDALALAAQDDPVSWAVLVVCDGVSNTTDSDIASLAAARAARTVLEQPLSSGMGVAAAAQAAATKRLGEAVAAANGAVIGKTKQGDEHSPSCTFTGAIVDGRTAYVANVGDSRIYWLPDSGGGEQLSIDDSVAAEQIASGIERKVAETGPMAHSITRWLGIDAPDDLTPHTRTIQLSEPGWLMLCTDGLWNYCSEAGALHDKIVEFQANGTPAQPLPLARALVGFANNAGGADNITVALARIPADGEDIAAAGAVLQAPAPEATAEVPPVPGETSDATAPDPAGVTDASTQAPGIPAEESGTPAGPLEAPAEAPAETPAQAPGIPGGQPSIPAEQTAAGAAAPPTGETQDTESSGDLAGSAHTEKGQ